jgi:hypothetical protein
MYRAHLNSKECLTKAIDVITVLQTVSKDEMHKITTANYSFLKDVNTNAMIKRIQKFSNAANYVDLVNEFNTVS